MSDALEDAVAPWVDRPRAEACHLVLVDLRDRIEAHLVIVCRIAWEIHERGWWAHVRRPDGRAWQTEEDYFANVLLVDSHRSAAKRMAVGRVLAALPEAERPAAESGIAVIGINKAAVLAPALEAADSAAERERWLTLARTSPVRELQAEVSRALGAKPRGAPAPDALYRTILNAMPTLDDRETVERFFLVGKRVGAGQTAVGVLVAGMMEALSTWEAHNSDD